VADLYVPGHTDLGSLTLLFRQPVAALQVLAADGAWRLVKPQDGTITINTADALAALTGGYIKSSVHRVHAPPPDQADVDRFGVLYFSRYVPPSLPDRVPLSLLLSSSLVPSCFSDDDPLPPMRAHCMKSSEQCGLRPVVRVFSY
jgi:isopenicillin N synthase-like dioxygenase